MNLAITDEQAARRTAIPDPHERSVTEIISRGKQSRPGALSGFLLALGSGGLLWASFTPVDFGPLAWIALVPLLLLALPAQRTRWMYRMVYAAGLLYWLASLQWMRLGDPTMYLAWAALSAYLAFYWTGFLALTRLATHRIGLPLVIAVPVFWTGLEYLRAYLLTGFSWYYLGHSQHRWLEAIQISDLFGGYAVSFVVAAANAAVVTLFPRRWLLQLGICWPGEEVAALPRGSRRRQLASVGGAAGLLLATLAYGSLRLSQAEFPIGPRVGLVQGNFIARADNFGYDPEEIYLTHRALTGLAVPYQPDLIVWPEGMFPYPLYEFEQGMTDARIEDAAGGVPAKYFRERQTHNALSDLADMANAALLIGLSTLDVAPEEHAIYNSAAFVQPGAGVVGRYDKIHRVPFGEYIPFSGTLSFLSWLTPYRGDFGIDAGRAGQVFRFRDSRFIPLICFEDTVPQLVRSLARSADVNAESGSVLVNMTNDGWFHGSSELDQHLITASFRCVETRTPMVRAVNTGISAVIDGNGVVREPAKFIDFDAQTSGDPPRDRLRDPRTGRYHKQLNCTLIADVPLDPRSSFYVRCGDWFALVCLVACAALGLQGMYLHRRARLS